MDARVSFPRKGGLEATKQRRDDRVATRATPKAVGLSALMNALFEWIAPSPWWGHAGFNVTLPSPARPRTPLYTADQRRRRDASPWTLVQGILAPLQFLIFAVSLALVLRYLLTGQGYEWATASILTKTVALYTIMITGAVWEKEVFGEWLFVPAFFWEDVFSMLVLGLQTAYLAALYLHWGSPRNQMLIAVAAYAAYVINATQFLLKLRAARLERARDPAPSADQLGRAA
jgi:3-vinyl bacteriochlorophyllide hydratase